MVPFMLYSCLYSNISAFFYARQNNVVLMLVYSTKSCCVPYNCPPLKSFLNEKWRSYQNLPFWNICIAIASSFRLNWCAPQVMRMFAGWNQSFYGDKTFDRMHLYVATPITKDILANAKSKFDRNWDVDARMCKDMLDLFQVFIYVPKSFTSNEVIEFMKMFTLRVDIENSWTYSWWEEENLLSDRWQTLQVLLLFSAAINGLENFANCPPPNVSSSQLFVRGTW